MLQPRRYVTSTLVTLRAFVVFSSLARVLVVASEAYECSAGQDPHAIAISLGPSYSSVGKIQHGARRSPLNGQSFAVMNMDHTVNVSYSCPSFSNAFFNTSYMVCDIIEPEYFMHRVIKNQRPSDDSVDDHREKHNLRHALPIILYELKETAEAWAQHEIESAVVAVPTYFSEDDRSEVKKAGTSVGLEVVRIMNTSTAAGFGYGIDKLHDEATHVVFYELGREYFEVSFVEVDMGVFDHHGAIMNPKLGKEIARLIKHKRTTGASCFDASEMGHFEQTLAYVDKVIQDANISRSEIVHFVVTGDYTRAPQVRSMVEAFFDGKRAAVLDTGDDFQLVPGTLDHDELVTYGAAIFADILAGYDSHEEVLGRFYLQARTLSVETIGGEALRMFQRWTILPARKILNFTTTVDGQSAVLVSVFQGELPEARKNDEVATIRLDCIPSAPRGVLKVHLVLEMYPDDLGNLKLNATAHLVGAEELCFDTTTAVLLDFAASRSLDGKDFELEAAYVYGRSKPGLPGSCANRQKELRQHYVIAAEEH